MRQIGIRQLAALARIASPEFIQIVPGKEMEGLRKRGLVEYLSDDGFARITPEGCAELGRALRHGRFNQPMPDLTPTVFISAASYFEKQKIGGSK